MKKITVLHLRSSEFFGGPERAILGQCASMDGFRFCCASFVRPGGECTFLEKAEQLQIPNIALTERHVGDFAVAGSLRALIKSQGLDLIVSHDYKATFFAMLAAKGLGVAHIRHFRGVTWENKKVHL